jgi:Cu+-exporting ATPase
LKPSSQIKTKPLNIERISLPVEGMTCASCVSRVEKTLAKFEGVNDVSVNLANEKASFSFDPDKIDFKDLAKTIADAGYKLNLSSLKKNTEQLDNVNAEFDSHYNELKSAVIISIILTVPIVLINMGMMWKGFFLHNVFSIEQLNKILLLLTTPLIFVPGKRFFTIFWNNLKHLTADMNSLVAIGTGAAFIYSTLVTLFPEFIINNKTDVHVYYDTTAVIITLILLGRLLESRAKSRTGTAVKKLIELQPKSALVKINGKEIEKSIDDLNIGDIVIVKPGGKIPADGIIIAGSSNVNESMITGESLPVDKSVDSKVIGGTINTTGTFDFRVTVTGKNSVLGQIIKLVEEAQGSKAPIQQLADKVASIFVPAVVGIAVVTLITWIMIEPQNFSFALLNFVGVLIIACPCALGLATPTALIVGMGKGAQHGILIKNGQSLEELHKIDTLIFDKTGTITEGKLSVSKIYFEDLSEKEFLSYLASLENRSEHPIAKAVMNFTNEKNIEPIEIKEFESVTGRGIKGRLYDLSLIAGNESFMNENEIDLKTFNNRFENSLNGGSTIIYLAIDNKVKGFVSINDSVKKNSKDIIGTLKTMNIDPVLLSGDNESVTKIVSENVGIADYESEVLPENKSDIVKKYQSDGNIVAMVGDGINDAPALAQSNVGIAIGTGTDVAIESAQVVLMSGDLTGVIKAIKLSKQTIRVIKQNLFWAFFYNVIGIPLAAIGLLNPMFAALAMSFSSFSVVSNSLRLKRAKL